MLKITTFLTLLVPFTLGVIGILQGGLNRQISNTIGVAQATLISNIVTVLICIAFYFFVKSFPQFFPEFFRIKAPIATYQWWYIFPAIFGFMIVAGLPYAIAEIGAVRVIILLVAAQMLTGVAWDYWVEHIHLSPQKFLGMVAAMISVLLITLDKS